MPTSIAATLGTQPRPPLADPAPQQGEAYGNIKWLLMGPWERKGQLARVHAVMRSEGGSGNQECEVLILSCGTPVCSLISLHILVWTI